MKAGGTSWRRAGRLLAACAVSAFVAALPATSLAQQTQLAPSPVIGCLTHKDGKTQPAYPDVALERKDGGELTAVMEFRDATSRPRVSFSNDFVGRALEEAVREHVSGLRLPCMAPDSAPVVVRQSFVFNPNDGRRVATTRPRDAADDARARQLICVKHVDGATAPRYSEASRRSEVQGKVYVQLTFDAADKPPQVTVISAPPFGDLRHAVQRHVEGLRMPCLEGASVSVRQVYIFQMEEGARVHIRDMPLLDFLRAVKDLPSNVRFDLDKMGCPFDLRIRYMQPHSLNGVYELDVSRSSRLPLLDWLAGLQFNLPPDRHQRIFAETFTVRVPCGVIDL